jgi:hypothetical protein
LLKKETHSDPLISRKEQTMKFIKLNCWGDKSYTFPLDFVALMHDNYPDTMIRLMDGTEIVFQMDYEGFISRVFSDEEGDHKEYQHIEIEYKHSQPTIDKDESDEGQLSKGI